QRDRAASGAGGRGRRVARRTAPAPPSPQACRVPGMNPATIAFVGLGGNVGDAAATLREAVSVLDGLPDTQLVRASRLYRTPAWGRVDQPDFVNAVAKLETRLEARELLDALLEVE